MPFAEGVALNLQVANVIQPARSEPSFAQFSVIDTERSSANVTAALGKTALLTCRTRGLDSNRTVFFSLQNSLFDLIGSCDSFFLVEGQRSRVLPIVIFPGCLDWRCPVDMSYEMVCYRRQLFQLTDSSRYCSFKSKSDHEKRITINLKFLIRFFYGWWRKWIKILAGLSLWSIERFCFIAMTNDDN